MDLNACKLQRLLVNPRLFVVRHSREGGNPCLAVLGSMGPRLRGDDEPT